MTARCGDTLRNDRSPGARPPAVIERFTRDAGAAVKVPDDAAGTKGQFADEASCTLVASSGRIDEAELALLELEHGDVGFGSNIEIAQLGTADLRGGI